MSANLTGSTQKYEPPAIRIFQGLKPDIVAIQEFNYSNNTESAIQNFINMAFGTNYYYFRETNSEYSLPNGVISRFPIIKAGSYDDLEIPDRGFCYAVIDIPGENELVVFSVHLKAGSDSAFRRASEILQLKSIISTNFINADFIVVAGDFNFYSQDEAGYRTIITFLSDFPIPQDTEGNPDTNLNRDKRYDYIFTTEKLSNLSIPVKIGLRFFTNGLVFDSRTFTPLSDVKPVQSADSASAQHMAVIKDFSIAYWITNYLTVENPRIQIERNGILRWRGGSNLAYSVYSSSNLLQWNKLGITTSSADSYMFFINPFTNKMLYFRVSYP